MKYLLCVAALLAVAGLTGCETLYSGEAVADLLRTTETTTETAIDGTVTVTQREYFDAAHLQEQATRIAYDLIAVFERQQDEGVSQEEQLVLEIKRRALEAALTALERQLNSRTAGAGLLQQ